MSQKRPGAKAGTDDGDTPSKPARASRDHTSAAALETAAIDYLARYSSSRIQLRRVLERRIRRWAEQDGTDPAAARGLLPDLLAKLERNGLLDDRRFAAGHAASLQRRGRSLARIKLGLAQRGVAGEIATETVKELAAGNPAADFAAAANHARRRRLGPYRAPAERRERRDKDLASLARAGFAYETARRVIDAASSAALEAAAAATEED
ncbi:MAG: RecX family transcriptional regulator [Dongiaceae bacterium]